MALNTKIQYADSTCNLQMGCDGCELWRHKTATFHCYAGIQTGIYAGKKGWPSSFTQPAIFPERMDIIARWSDLTGTLRRDKPWLDHYPRIIFMNDMGDTWTESLPDMWLAPYVERLAAMPHRFIFLTKRAQAMQKFFDTLGYVPKNFWLLVSITSQVTVSRVRPLQQIKQRFPMTTVGVSLAPLWGMIDLPWSDIDWVITEGESGKKDALVTNPDWLRQVRDRCAAVGTPFFHKQNGAWLHESQWNDNANNTSDNDYTLRIFGGLYRYTGINGGGRMLDGQLHNGMPVDGMPVDRIPQRKSHG